MEHFFFNLDGDFDTVAGVLFKAVGLDSPTIGESANVLGGSYAEARTLGLRIRLEENSYDYEDDYRFMVSVKQDSLSELSVREEDIRLVAKQLAGLLVENAGVSVGIEVGDKLEQVSPLTGQGG